MCFVCSTMSVNISLYHYCLSRVMSWLSPHAHVKIGCACFTLWARTLRNDFVNQQGNLILTPQLHLYINPCIYLFWAFFILFNCILLFWACFQPILPGSTGAKSIVFWVKMKLYVLWSEHGTIIYLHTYVLANFTQLDRRKFFPGAQLLLWFQI